MYHIVPLLPLLLVLVWSSVVYCGPGQFYGGSLSYVLEDTENGTKLVKVSLITGWVLGKGPCWKDCKKSDLGRSTLPTRALAIAAENDNYLGEYSADYVLGDDDETIIYPMEKLNPSPITERVIDISEDAEYEQEIQTMSFFMPNDTDTLDLNFEGLSWRSLTLQGGSNLKWHFQTRISVFLRNDTNSTNHCPQTLSRPFFRVKLGQVSKLRIPAVDADGDFIRCRQADFIEGGGISNHKPPNVTIYDNCTVSIEATIANGFRDDTWLGIPVSVRDYNKRPIIYGPDELTNSQFSLSSTTLQFVVQVLENLTTPEFVDPTEEGNHLFIMYADTTWRTEIFALASKNTTISSFTAFGIKQEDLRFSELQYDPRQDRLSHGTMSWQPSEGEVGRHIACVQATDSTGVDSAEQRCFILDVQADTFNHTTQITPGKPYFVDIPSPDQLVNCKMEATCVVPLYVKCAVEIVEIKVKESFIEDYHIGPIETVQHKGQTLYKADLFFHHSMHGLEKLCLYAKDKSGIESETVCITSEIEPPDPCISSPCQNSGICHPDKTTGGYQCQCLDRVSGRNCEILHDRCTPNPCHPVHAYCSKNPRHPLCYCKPGYTGQYCYTDINDCELDSCNYHGSCIDDGVNKFKCECYSRYNGTHCENDTCPEHDASYLTCPAANCSGDTCNRNGVCLDGGACSCSSGFSGATCNTGVCDISGTMTGIQILSPSVKDGSSVICYHNGHTFLPCHTRIYLASSSGSKPAVTIDTSLETGVASVNSIAASNDFPGKTGVYSADLFLNGNIQTLVDQFVCINAQSGALTTSVCLELKLITDPLKDPNSMQSIQANARIKFVDPSLKENSRIICKLGEPCTIQLYTSFMTNKTCNVQGTPSSVGSVGSCGSTDVDNDDGLGYSCCDDVIASSVGVTVFPAHARGPACVTEATMTFSDPGEKDICFLSGQVDNQQICYTVGVYAPNTDPCENSKCQNGGHCFHVGHDDYRCVCTDEYEGENCEKGPCQPADNKCNTKAYCQIDNGTATCICEAGYNDQFCRTFTSSGLQTVGYAKLTDTARPTIYTCVIYQTCSLELIISGITGQKPTVVSGYVSPSLALEEISLVNRPGFQDSYLAAIRLKTSKLGTYDACLQTKDNNGVNRDELCFDVNVISDVQSIYGFKDRPHFVDPSLLTDTEVACPIGTPCHVLFHATTGVGNEHECVTYKTKAPDDFLNYHVFTSCDNCVPSGSGDGQCSLDFSVVTSDANNRQLLQFCVELGMKGSNVTGEERCFKVKVVSHTAASVKIGCQRKQCLNGGFCDGHIPLIPICYCPSGYTGQTCEKVQVPANFTGAQSFISDFSIPSEVSCRIGKPCVVPFKTLTKPGVTCDVSIGYADPHMIVDKPVVQTITTNPAEHKGYIGVSSKDEGTYTVCLQATTLGTVDDEQCVKITFIDAGSSNIVDETKPYFLIPTMPADSSILCQINKPCHLDMHFTNGNHFGAAGKCPIIVDKSSDAIKGLHIFESKFHTKECTTDIVYVAAAVEENTLCLMLSLPGKNGEKRCYTIKVVPDITKEVVSPCKGTTCDNGGRCVGNPATSKTSGTCICSDGFYGTTCSTAQNTSTNLPGILNVKGHPLEPVHFSNVAAIPEVVKCTVGNPCCVQIPFYANGNETPFVGSMGLLTTESSQSFTSDPTKDHHVFVQCVKGPSGDHTLCIQTTTNGTENGTNIDEICAKIEISAGPASPSPTLDPHFTTGTTNGTVLVCKPNSICHIPVVTGANGSICSQVHECGDGIPGLHVFDTAPASSGNNCITDVAVTTGTTGSVEICVSAGKDGEENHLIVKSENKQEFGPCQKKHCMNGGKCEATSMSVASCVCKPGYTGTLCDTDIDDCKANPCMNNATCVDGINQYTCQCLTGFNGTDCETDIDDCAPNPCSNNGFCTDEVNGYSCICMPGYAGPSCTAAHKPLTNLPGVEKTNGLLDGPVHFSNEGAIPEVVQCTSGTPCCVNIPYNAQNNETPILGNIGALTSTSSRSVTSDPTSDNHVFIQCVTGPAGNHNLCLQTTSNGTEQGINIDEVCVKVDISTASATIPTHLPGQHFTSGSTNGTTVVCKPSSTCYIPVVTEQHAGKCSQVLHCGVVAQGLHVFETKPSTIGNDCITNVAFNTGLADNVELCISTGNGSEKMNLVVKTENKQEFGPCQKKHCVNGGKCLATSFSVAECVCEHGYTGTLCETNIDDCKANPCMNNATCIDGINQYTCHCLTGFNGTDCETELTTTSSSTSTSPTTTRPATTTTTSTSTASTTPASMCGSRTHSGVATSNEQCPPAFIAYTIPEIIRCTINKRCSIILPVDGKPGITPHVQHGHYDPALTTEPISVAPRRGATCHSSMTRCDYQATITVIPTEIRLFKYCVQTTDNNMVNADELCYNIQGLPDSQITKVSGFVYPPTLPENSTMSCPSGQTCHYQIEVNKQAGKCDLSLVQSQWTAGGINITKTDDKTTSCGYDIAVTTPVGTTGNKSFCLGASSGTTPTCLVIDVENKDLDGNETCSLLHCANGGFCDSVDGQPSRCLCKPGFSGKKCELSDSCGISVPDTIKCSGQQDCEFSFIVTGSKPNVAVDNGAEVKVRPAISYGHIVDVAFPTSTNASKICVDVHRGSCVDHGCVTVTFDLGIPTSTTPGGFLQSQLQYTCESQSDCFVTASTRPKNNKCPDIIVHKDTTVASSHVFEPVQSDAKCRSTIAVTGNTTAGENQQICLRTETGSQQCIEIKMKYNEEPCDNKKASENARKMVKTGYASCTCMYNGKKLNIIKKRPDVKPEKLYKAAGFGAGGMVGTMLIGTVIYAVVSKVKSKPTKNEKPKPSPRMRHKVHPHRRQKIAF